MWGSTRMPSVNPVPEGRYLEDLQVGDRFTSGEHRMDAAEIKAFAAQFDPQPFHLDEEAAKDTFFGGLAASGWHTLGVAMRLLADGGLPIAGGIIGGSAEVQWPIPTRPGDILKVDSEVLEVRPSRSKPDRGMVKMRCVTRNQRAEIVQSVEIQLLVFRRHPSPA